MHNSAIDSQTRQYHSLTNAGDSPGKPVWLPPKTSRPQGSRDRSLAANSQRPNTMATAARHTVHMPMPPPPSHSCIPGKTARGGNVGRAGCTATRIPDTRGGAAGGRRNSGRGGQTAKYAGGTTSSMTADGRLPLEGYGLAAAFACTGRPYDAETIPATPPSRQKSSKITLPLQF